MVKQFATVLALVLFLSGCAKPPYDKIEYIEAEYMYYETTLEGLEKRASNIVIGKLLDDSHTVYTTKNRNVPKPLYSAVSFEIIDVIVGNLKAGETITIIESYYISDRVLWTRGNYLPSIPNQEYVFYLGNQVTDMEEYEGAYFAIHEENGRYLVPNDEKADLNKYTRQELSLGKKSIELYMQLYHEVVDAYAIHLQRQ